MAQRPSELASFHHTDVQRLRLVERDEQPIGGLGCCIELSLAQLLCDVFKEESKRLQPINVMRWGRSVFAQPLHFVHRAERGGYRIDPQSDILITHRSVILSGRYSVNPDHHQTVAPSALSERAAEKMSAVALPIFAVMQNIHLSDSDLPRILQLIQDHASADDPLIDEQELWLAYGLTVSEASDLLNDDLG